MTSIPTRAIDIRPPAISIRGSVATAMVTMLLLGFPLVVTAAIAPKFDEIFRDFGVPLPALTRLFIQIGRALSTPLGWVATIAIISAIIVPACIVARRSRAAAGALLLVAMIVAGVYFMLLVMSMFGPLNAMIQSLQAKP